MVVVYFSKVVVVLQLGERHSDEAEVAFLQYIDVAVPLGAASKSPGGISVRWITPEEMYHSARSKEQKRGLWMQNSGMYSKSYRR